MVLFHTTTYKIWKCKILRIKESTVNQSVKHLKSDLPSINENYRKPKENTSAEEQMRREWNKGHISRIFWKVYWNNFNF